MPKPRTEQSNREYGTTLEQTVANKFIEIGFHQARPTSGSGCGFVKGDITGIADVAHVECKRVNKPNITIKQAVWHKLNEEISLHSKKIPMYVLQNSSDVKLVCLDINDFFTILKGYLDNER
jgi:Holliday junction resolvase